MKERLMVVAGPTAVGKSKTAVCCAKALQGEIISADAFQVYRGMDIGTAKITRDEMGGVAHHLLDVVDPKEGFDVSMYQAMGKACLQEIYARNKLPILCGGAGFYIQALTQDIDFTSAAHDEALRKELEDYAATHGAHALYERLLAVDPDAALSMHENNVKRVIRAIEFFEASGQKISAHNNAEREKESPYDLLYIVITMDRESLYAQIDARVDEMFAQGLLDEVAALQASGSKREDVAMQGLGYKEVFDYLDGRSDLEECRRRIQRDSRHYAKRQMTWFRRVPEAVFIDRKKEETAEDVCARILARVKKHGW